MAAQLALLQPEDAHPLEAAGSVGMKPTRLAVWVKYTGLLRAKHASHTLFDPPLERMLMTVLEDVERHPSSVEVIAAPKDREPPVLHGSIVLLTRDRDEAGKPRRWPICNLVPLIGELPLHDVQEAFVKIGGRV